MAWPTTGEWITAGVGGAQVITAGLIVRLTKRLAGATRQYADDTRALLAESVQHRNLLERQINGPTIESVREASITLYDRAKTAISGGEMVTLLLTWTDAMSNRALALPPDLFDVLVPGVMLADDLVKSVEKGTNVGLQGLRLLACHIALATQNHLNAYWRNPGEPLDAGLFPLPEAGSDYPAWLASQAETAPS